MIELTLLEWLFAILVMLIFVNRYLFGSLLRLLDLRTKTEICSKPTYWPSVTIITPVFNEGPGIINTADSFAALDYPVDKLNIVFVDDVSTDDSWQHLQRVKEKYPWMDIQKNPYNMGKRLGIRHTVLSIESELVLSIDSDVIVEKSALRNMVTHMHSTGADAVGGCVFISNANENWLTRMQAVKYWVGYTFLKNVENSFSHVMCLSGCLTLYKRKALLAIDGDLQERRFLGDEVKYGEDRYLTRKLIERGLKTRLTFDARCYTKAHNKLNNYLSQQLRWRRSNMIDQITAIPHYAKFNPYVLVNYISLGLILFFYPLVLIAEFLRFGFLIPLLIHMMICSCFSVAYDLNKHKLPEQARTQGIWFIGMALMFPIIYMTMNPLALATLGTTSWETRKAKMKAKFAGVTHS